MMKKLKISICLLALVFAFGSLSWAEGQKEEKMIVAQKEVAEETTRQEVKKDKDPESETLRLISSFTFEVR